MFVPVATTGRLRSGVLVVLFRSWCANSKRHTRLNTSKPHYINAVAAMGCADIAKEQKRPLSFNDVVFHRVFNGVIWLCDFTLRSVHIFAFVFIVCTFVSVVYCGCFLLPALWWNTVLHIGIYIYRYMAKSNHNEHYIVWWIKCRLSPINVTIQWNWIITKKYEIITLIDHRTN